MVLLLALAGGWWWTRSQDFYHQPSSYRYRAIGNDDEALLAKWRARGPEGIQELARRIPVRNRYLGEKYQSFVQWLQRKNLPTLVSWLPVPRVSERILRSWSCVCLLANLGPDACTPQTVAALAKLVEDPDYRLVHKTVECLQNWGAAASNALPALLNAQRKEAQNGGRVRSVVVSLIPDYRAALASIGVNSKEILIVLLSVKTKSGSNGYAETWCHHSSQAPVILAEIVTNQSIELELKMGAIQLAGICRVDTLLPFAVPMLTDPTLGKHWAGYVSSLMPKAGPYWGTILDQIDTAFSSPFSTNFGPNTFENFLTRISELGRFRAGELFPIMLTHAWDEKWPFIGSLAWPNQPRNLHFDFAAHLRILAPDPEVYHKLILSGLAHSDWRVRAGAAEQLLFAKLGPREIEALSKCLQDENATVRAIAAQLLLRVEAHRPEALKETWTVITNQTLPFRRRICAIGSVRGEWLSAGDKLEAAKILDTLAEEPEAELRNRALAKRKELTP